MTHDAAITVATLADALGASFEGDPTAELTSVATLAEARPGQLAWLGDEKHKAALARTRASAVLVRPGTEVPPHVTAIFVDDPDLALCDALRLIGPQPPRVEPGIDRTARVHETAKIEPGAAIGPNVYVGPGAVVGAGTQLHPGVYVGEHARIGSDCVLWPNVVVRERVRIGDRVIIHPNATIGADGFGYLQRDGRHVKIPQVGTVVIEDDVEIGANTTIDRARSGQTRIGRGTKIDNLVQIGHNCDIGPGCIIVAQCGISGSTKLGAGSVLGGQVGIIDHLTLGRAVRIAAQSGVTADVPDGGVIRGTPAVPLRDFVKQTQALRRLPETEKLVHELLERIQRLESAADHRQRS